MLPSGLYLSMGWLFRKVYLPFIFPSTIGSISVSSLRFPRSLDLFVLTATCVSSTSPSRVSLSLSEISGSVSERTPHNHIKYILRKCRINMIMCTITWSLITTASLHISSSFPGISNCWCISRIIIPIRRTQTTSCVLYARIHVIINLNISGQFQLLVYTRRDEVKG